MTFTPTASSLSLPRSEWQGYLDCPQTARPSTPRLRDLRWCDTLIFVYPTWWYGLPAILKGWLDRVLLPDVAFLMPDGANKTIRPGLQHISRLVSSPPAGPAGC